MVLTGAMEETFVVLSPEKLAAVEPADETLYARLDRDYDNFKGHELISCYEFSKDWPSWEVHPNGDEIVVLLAGQATFLLELDSGETSVSLDKTGSYVVVPKGVWHTAKVSETAKLLFITPGEGTQHKSSGGG